MIFLKLKVHTLRGIGMNKPFICLRCKKSFIDLELARIHKKWSYHDDRPRKTTLEDFYQ